MKINGSLLVTKDVTLDLPDSIDPELNLLIVSDAAGKLFRGNYVIPEIKPSTTYPYARTLMSVSGDGLYYSIVDDANSDDINDIQKWAPLTGAPITNYVPLNGTTVGNPITNGLHFKDGNPNFLTFLDSSDGEIGSIINNGVSVRFKSNSPDGEAIFDASGISSTRSQIIIITTGVTPKGLIGSADYSNNITALCYVQKSYVDSKTGSIALSTITESGQIGYRLTSSDPADFGDIGVDAVDFSYSGANSSVMGATGESSFAQGADVIASAYGAVVFGQDINNNGDLTAVFGIGGAVTDGYGNFLAGAYNIVTSGAYATVVGQFAEAVVNNIADVNAGSNTMFAVGNGTATGAGLPQSRNTAFKILRSGIVNINNTPIYATNAAAISGGLVLGDIYKLATGELRTVV